MLSRLSHFNDSVAVPDHGRLVIIGKIIAAIEFIPCEVTVNRLCTSRCCSMLIGTYKLIANRSKACSFS